MSHESGLVAAGNLESPIRKIRGQKVILDSDLARVFGMPTFDFNQAVKRRVQPVLGSLTSPTRGAVSSAGLPTERPTVLLQRALNLAGQFSKVRPAMPTILPPATNSTATAEPTVPATTGFQFGPVARRPAVIVVALAALVLTGCASSSPSRSSTAAPRSAAGIERGKASYYGAKYQGRKTASGETFDKNGLTAAHPNLTFGTRVRVTNLENGKSVVVRINDRYPPIKGRIIDLSEAAFARIAPLAQGVIPVTVEPVK